MNRWTFLTVLVLVAGVVATFAIYTFGWNGSEADERGQARAYAEQLACFDRSPPTPCRTINAVERVAPGIWRVDLGMEGARLCVQIDIDEFRFTDDGRPTGFGPAACASR